MQGAAPLEEDRHPPPRLARLLGARPLSGGVVHVAAGWEDPAGSLRVLRIEPRTPKSAEDFYLLNAARARAEAIVTTGAILRAEPDVRWELQGTPGVVEELRDWRLQGLGLRESPRLAVLTSGRDLDVDHAGLGEGVEPLVVTGRDGERRLAGAAAVRGIDVVALDRPGIGATLAELRRRGWRRMTVEAGPSTAAGLYEPAEDGGLGVDELWLSTFRGDVEAEVVGPSLLSREAMEQLLRPWSDAFEVEEPSGPWRFQRYRPRPVRQ